MADTLIIAKNLEQYAEQAFGAEYMKNMTSTFGAYAAADMAISIHARDVQHSLIEQQAALAFGHDIKAFADSKTSAGDREAFLAQVEKTLGTHGGAAKEFLKTYYDGLDSKNQTVQQTGWAAFTKEVEAANHAAYALHAKDHVRGAVAVEGSGEFIAAFGGTAKLNHEVLAYAAARKAQAQGKDPIFGALENSAQKRLDIDLATNMHRMIASQSGLEAATNAIKAGMTGALDDLQIIQDGKAKGNPAAVKKGEDKLLLDEQKFLANVGGDLSTALAGLGITGGQEAVPGAPQPGVRPPAGPNAKQH